MKLPEGELCLSIHGMLTWFVFVQQYRGGKMGCLGPVCTTVGSSEEGNKKQTEMGGREVGG